MLIRLLRLVPRPFAYGLVALAIPWYVLFDSRGRRSSYRFYRQGMGFGPLKAAGYVFRNMYRMGTVVVDRFSAYGGKGFRFIPPEEDFYDTLSYGTDGFVVLGSHVGNYEMVGYSFPTRKPMKVLVYAGETATVMDNRRRMLGKANITVVPVLPDLSHLFTLNAALAGGEVVSMTADRSFGSGKTLRHPFLGKDAAFPAGPFQLAASRGVPVLAAFVMKEKWNTYHIYQFRIPYNTESSPRLRLQELSANYAAILEKMVRRYPDQWYNFYDFWA